MKAIEYEYFECYMKKMRHCYNPYLFSTDIMYFCKIWKSQRYLFAQFCKQKNIETAYLFLNQRCVDYELHWLDHKRQSGNLDELEYQKQFRYIHKIYL